MQVQRLKRCFFFPLSQGNSKGKEQKVRSEMSPASLSRSRRRERSAARHRRREAIQPNPWPVYAENGLA